MAPPNPLPITMTSVVSTIAMSGRAPAAAERVLRGERPAVGEVGKAPLPVRVGRREPDRDEPRMPGGEGLGRVEVSRGVVRDEHDPGEREEDELIGAAPVEELDEQRGPLRE